MKVVSTEALTKLIQLVKSAFIKVDDVVEVTEIETETPSEITLATVATSGSYNDLSNKPTVDQTYDGISTNAQSGVAVAQALADKADDSEVVHRTGNETITDLKTFKSNSNGVALATKSQLINSDVTPPSIYYSNYIDAHDINGKLLSRIYTYKLPNGSNGLGLQAWKDSTVYGITIDSAGNTAVPTPPTSDNSAQIATTAFVNNKFQVVSTLPASPNASVFYFIPE